jgi:hypothetical protein
MGHGLMRWYVEADSVHSSTCFLVRDPSRAGRSMPIAIRAGAAGAPCGVYELLYNISGNAD